MKLKAIFMIFTIICSIFYVSFMAQPVKATQYTGYCCAKNNQGEYCKQASSQNDCDSDFSNAYGVACAYADFCAVGCCVSSDGSCFKNSNKVSCQDNNGQWNGDSSCNSINSCQKGCCVLGNTYSYKTQKECENDYSIFPNLVIDFRAVSENECNNLNLLKQEGCCAESCSYGTKEACNAISTDPLDFKPNTFCSSLELCSSTCQTHNNKQCVDEDVYWFDSCGNKEDKAEDCDRSQGTVCGSSGNIITCRSMDCDDTIYGVRKHGESWCDYDNKDKVDSVGSRHYLRSCIDGKVVYDECRDFREEVCIQGTNEQGLTEANCILNDGSIIPKGHQFWEGGGCTDFGNSGVKSAELDDDSGLIQYWVNQQSVNCSQISDCGNKYNYLGILSKGGLTSNCGAPTTYPSAASSALQMGTIISGSLGGIFSGLAAIKSLAIAGWATPLGLALMGAALVMTILSLAGIFGDDKVVCSVTCNDWIPPAGGDDCTKCTADKTKPCTEYKCKSLGDTCEFINEGTDYEACTSVIRTDVLSPVITPWNEILTSGFTIQSTSTGYKIKENIPADEEIVFGIKTNEPSRCKYDMTPDKTYDEMANYFGLGLLLEAHNQTIIIPAYFSDPQFYSVTLGQYKLYIRCRDANGNANKDSYVISLQSSQAEDNNPPAIIDAITTEGVRNNEKLSYQTNETDLMLYLNEPAECKYSKDSDTSYDAMSNDFVCATAFNQIDLSTGYFKCTAHLTNLRHDVDTKLYIKCKDRPSQDIRNTNQESEQFTLSKTLPLKIKSALPKGEVLSTTATLELSTEKGSDENGNAVCEFADTPAGPFIPFLHTSGNAHTQPLGSSDSPLEMKKYTYYIRCTDSANTIATDKIEFNIAVDRYPPQISSITKDGNNVVVTLNDNSLCEYSTASFAFGSGTSTGSTAVKIHTFPSADSLFIQCKDINNNPVIFSVYT